LESPPVTYMSLYSLMSWQADKKRWRKFHEGKWYFVSCATLGTPKTRQGSRTGANKWWLEKLASLRESKINPNFTWSNVFQAWESQHETSLKSPARIHANIRMTKFFSDFVGHQTRVNSFDEQVWLAFSNHLRTLLAKGLAPNYLTRVQKTAAWLVRFAWENRFLPELPRNLTQRHLFLPTEKKDIVVFKIRDILKFFYKATGQTRLHLLLMLNCGFSAVDISNLRESEIHWDEKVLIHKRIKTKHHDHVPTITYPLWPSTFALLNLYKSGSSKLLLTKTGNPWVTTSYSNGKYTHTDAVASNFRRIALSSGAKIYPRGLRATAASNLAQHPNFKFYCEHYLGHSPKTVANTHYVKPCQEEFKEAIFWLGERFCLGDI
jgi:integrase